MPYNSTDELRSDVNKIADIYKHMHPHKIKLTFFGFGHLNEVKDIQRFVSNRNNDQPLHEVIAPVLNKLKIMADKLGYKDFNDPKFVDFLNRASPDDHVFLRSLALIAQRAGNITAGTIDIKGYNQISESGFVGYSKRVDYNPQR